MQRIRQYVTPSQYREITFTYWSDTKSLKTMVFDGKTWTYTQDPIGSAGYSRLTDAQPPAGRDWSYTYHATTRELASIMSPSAGYVNFTYGVVTRYAGSTTRPARVVTQRTTSGHQINGGTWTFAYDGGTNKDETTVTGPCSTTRYRFYGIGLSGDFSAWLSGALRRRELQDGGVTFETETPEYVKSEAISFDGIPAQNGLWGDSAVFAPLVTKRTFARQGRVWFTDYTYRWGQGTFNDYGQPQVIDQQWEYAHKVTRTFQSGLTPHVLGLVSQEVAQNPWTSATTTTTYELSTGFPAERNHRGLITTFERNARGQVSAVEDGRGNRTTFSYNWGVVSQIQTPHLTTSRTINQEGRITAETVGSLTTTYTYDDLGRPTSVNPPGDDTVSAPTTYTWDYWGYWVQITRGAFQTHVNVDGFGRPWESWDSTGVKTKRTYNSCGRVTFESLPYTSGSGTIGTQYAYDALGRPTSVTGPDGGVTSYSYASGNDVFVTDPLNRQTRYNYIGAGHPDNSRLDTVIDANGKTTWYAYDLAGNLTRVGVTGVPVREWEYDAKGLLDESLQPESGTTRYDHDNAGNRTAVTDADGQVVTFTYDGNNRLKTRNGGVGIAGLTVHYDAEGRVWKQETPAGVTTYTFDTAGRIWTRTDAFGPLTKTTTYAYNAADQLLSVTYPSGRVVTYEYVTGRLDRVLLHGAPFATNFTYDGAGRLTSWQTGGVTHTRTYDAAGKLDALSSLGAGAQGLALDYAINTGGQITQIADPRPQMTQQFTYDALDRLTRATGGYGAIEWDYDDAGNRTAERRGSVTTYTVNPTTQRLTSLSGGWAETFGYDNSGRLVSDGRGTYSYTPVDRLLTASTGSATASYAYDADDLRVARTVNGLTTYTLRGAGGMILSEYQQACAGVAWTRDLIYAGGMLLGAVKAVSMAPVVSTTAAAVTIPETATTASVGVQLATGGGPSGCAVSVHWETRATTAAAGADVVLAAGTLTFPAGTAHGTTLTIPVSLLPDAWDEADETLVVALTGAPGGQLGAVASTTLTIADDDPTPVMSVTSVAVPEPEVSGSAVVTVTLSHQSGHRVTADFTTVGGTAVAGSDFLTVSGQVAFEPGTLSQTITIPILPDTVVEPAETFTVALTNVQHAPPPAGPATVTIQASDQLAVTLTANQAFPLAAGTSVTFTAATTGGTPPYEFQFYLTQHGTAQRVVQLYSTTPTFTWTPAIADWYTVHAWARPVGSGVPYESFAELGAFQITAAPPVTLTSVTPSTAYTVGAGTTVTWTVAGSGGVAPRQYRFSTQLNGGAWTTIRDWGSAATAVWVVPQQGSYLVRAEARRAGSSGAAEASVTSATFTGTTGGPWVRYLTADRPFPITPGTTVTWTAQAGGTGPVEYAWWLFRPSTGWFQHQAYGPSPTLTWTPTIADTWRVSVRVRLVGTTTPFHNLDVLNVGVGTSPIGSVGVTASQSLPVAAGTPITWTGNATGGSAPLLYQFWLYDATVGTWTMVRDWSATRTWTWTPAPASYGTHAVQVWIKATGSPNSYDAYAASGYFTVTP